MENKSIPSVKSYINEKWDLGWSIDDIVREYTKLHVEAAIQAAAKDAKIKCNEAGDIKKVRRINVNHTTVEFLSETSSTLSATIYEPSILNAYPLDKIV